MFLSLYQYYESYLILLNLFFSKIDGFNDLARTCSPLELFEMLDLIYKTFDARMDKYDVHKAGSQTHMKIPAVYKYEVQKVEAQIQIQNPLYKNKPGKNTKCIR